MKKVMMMLLCLLAGATVQAQWNQVSTGIHRDIRAISFPGTLTGYLGGTGPRVFRTFNGGQTWDSVDVRTLGVISNADVRQIQFLNGSEGYLLGGITTYKGQIFHTTNSGLNWAEVTPDSSISIQSIWFTDAQHGFAGDAFERIWRTTDGGLHWTAYHSLLYESASWVVAPDPAHVYAAGFDGTFGYRGRFFRSVDSGQTFTVVPFDSFNTQIQAISFPDASNGYALNYGFSVTRLFRTTNGGLTWDTLEVPGLNRIQFITADTGYAIFEDGDLYQTTNRGVNFTRVFNSDTLKALEVIHFRGKNGYAAGQDGSLIRLGAAPNSVGQVKEQLHMQVYPVPVSHQLAITFPVAETVYLDVTDVLGKPFGNTLAVNGRTSMDVGTWPSGVYLLHAVSGNSSAVSRIVVQH